jgi:quercetin dioxygenase-like cupin family protein
MAQTKTSGRLRAGHSFIEGTLSIPLLLFDLAEEIWQQRQEDSWLRDIGRSSKTLVKHRDLRIVLISMKANTRMHEHKATARISVQTVTGHIRLHLPERAVDLPAGHLLVLDQGLPHDVEALEDSAFLLTLSWPPEAMIQECKIQPRRKVRHDGT